jgi:peptidoglycan hydrolase-like protein with peptidoglycan-binding domain
MRGPAVAVAAAVLLAGACAHGREQARTEPGQGRAERGEGARERTARTGPGGKQQGMRPRPGAPRVPPTPEGLLGQDAVGKLQQALAQRGLLGRHRQGELDTATSAAVKRFQAQRGLAATGMPDRETLRELGVSPEEAYGTGGQAP